MSLYLTGKKTVPGSYCFVSRPCAVAVISPRSYFREKDRCEVKADVIIME